MMLLLGIYLKSRGFRYKRGFLSFHDFMYVGARNFMFYQIQSYELFILQILNTLKDQSVLCGCGCPTNILYHGLALHIRWTWEIKGIECNIGYHYWKDEK